MDDFHTGDKQIMVCMPCNWPGVEVIPGAQKRTCMKCGCDVLASRTDCTYFLCIRCLPRDAEVEVHEEDVCRAVRYIAEKN